MPESGKADVEYPIAQKQDVPLSLPDKFLRIITGDQERIMGHLELCSSAEVLHFAGSSL